MGFGGTQGYHMSSLPPQPVARTLWEQHRDLAAIRFTMIWGGLGIWNPWRIHHYPPLQIDIVFRV